MMGHREKLKCICEHDFVYARRDYQPTAGTGRKVKAMLNRRSRRSVVEQIRQHLFDMERDRQPRTAADEWHDQPPWAENPLGDWLVFGYDNSGQKI